MAFLFATDLVAGRRCHGRYRHDTRDDTAGRQSAAREHPGRVRGGRGQGRGRIGGLDMASVSALINRMRYWCAVANLGYSQADRWSLNCAPASTRKSEAIPL